MGINVRTYYRWVAEGGVTADRRPDADRPEPANKLSPEDTQLVAKKLVASFLNIQAFYRTNGFARPDHAAAAMLGGFELNC